MNAPNKISKRLAMTTAARDSQIISLTSPSGLVVEASCSANRVLDDFYSGYDAAFVLANEKEGYAGFVECLQLNSGAAYAQLKQRYGAFREFVLVAYDAETGARIGGANFIAFPLTYENRTDEVLLSINLNYIFTNPEVRNRGYFTRLVRDLPSLAFQLLMATNPDDVPAIWKNGAAAKLPKTLMFIEQNDPFQMSAEDYRLDTQHSGLDQFDRIVIWTKLGAKIIDFSYVQPPLTSSQQADHSLVFAVLGTESDTLDPCLLHEHLQRFFGISVLKGQEVMQVSSAAEQLTALQSACTQGKTIPLLNAQPLSDAARDLHPASLRDALRN
jgi:hypothetical protein